MRYKELHISKDLNHGLDQTVDSFYLKCKTKKVLKVINFALVARLDTAARSVGVRTLEKEVMPMSITLCKMTWAVEVGASS